MIILLTCVCSILHTHMYIIRHTQSSAHFLFCDDVLCCPWTHIAGKLRQLFWVLRSNIMAREESEKREKGVRKKREKERKG